MLKLIVAVDNDNAIGWSDGRLPWHIPADLKRFKALTTGGTILMGRNTYESLGRPDGLPNRKNVVISSTPKFDNLQITYIQDIKRIREIDENSWVIGGAQVYNQVIDQNLVDEIYLTRVYTNSTADVKINFNLADVNEFIQSEIRKCNLWSVVARHSEDTNPKTEYITLRKEEWK